MLTLLLLTTVYAQNDDTADEDAPSEEAPEGGEEDGEDSEDSEEPPLPPIDLSGAEALEELGGLTEEQHEFLEPKLGRLPPNPYQQTDFTAYTLEWGEFKIGAANLSVGVLPRVELGTSIVMDTIGIPNADLKINALRLGPVDFALLGSHYAIPMADFSGSRSQIGAGASVIIVDKWSLHTTANYNIFQADGLPDLRPLGDVVEWLTGNEISDYSVEAIEEQYDLHIRARSLTLGVGTDVRFNRRDSLVLQGSATLYSEVFTDNTGEGDLPPLFNLDQILAQDREGAVPLAESYVASIAYQAAWKRLELRIGVGASATPGAWLLQSTELSYRLGGKSRRNERQVYRSWKRNEGEVTE
ncbi:MAG: hypothetical protein ACI8RZ_007329 [Myxococcota bacterium]|jgi:hypothetical protein